MSPMFVLSEGLLVVFAMPQSTIIIVLKGSKYFQNIGTVVRILLINWDFIEHLGFVPPSSNN